MNPRTLIGLLCMIGGMAITGWLSGSPKWQSFSWGSKFTSAGRDASFPTLLALIGFGLIAYGLFEFYCGLTAKRSGPSTSSFPGGDNLSENTEQSEAFDPPLTTQQQERVDRLSQSDVALIDQTLLTNTTHQWRKVARVVGSTMMDLEDKITRVPDIYYAQRVVNFVNDGIFEAQGDLRRMRFSEVRLRTQ
jgi:hypothetical protein